SSLQDVMRRLYAIPRNLPQEWGDYAERREEPPETIRLDKPPFRGGNSNPVGEPAVRVVTYYKLELNNGTRLLHRVDEKRYDKNGKELPPYSGTIGRTSADSRASGDDVSDTRWLGVGMSASVALLGLVFVWWRRSRSASQVDLPQNLA